MSGTRPPIRLRGEHRHAHSLFSAESTRFRVGGGGLFGGAWGSTSLARPGRLGVAAAGRSAATRGQRAQATSRVGDGGSRAGGDGRARQGSSLVDHVSAVGQRPEPFAPGVAGRGRAASGRELELPGRGDRAVAGGQPDEPERRRGVWQQDRWSDGGSHGLLAAVSHNGGASWAYSAPHFSNCAGGTAANDGDFGRSSDPWVSWAPNGDLWSIAIGSTARRRATRCSLRGCATGARPGASRSCCASTTRGRASRSATTSTTRSR